MRRNTILLIAVVTMLMAIVPFAVSFAAKDHADAATGTDATATDATATDATATDGTPVNAFWDTVPGDGPVFPAAPTPIGGDLDGSGTLDPADARLALRYSVGLEPALETSYSLWLADVDGDGKATPADARLILRAAVGLDGFHLPDPAWDVYRIRTHGIDYEYDKIGALQALEANAPLVTGFDSEHLPLWRIDSGEALTRWLDAFEKEDNQPQTGLTDPEVPALLKRYGDAFFAENDLLICYKYEGSGGYLQALYRPVVKDGALTLTVCTAYQPEYGYTADIGSWFIFTPVAKELTAQCRTFDCLRGETVLLDRWPDITTEGGVSQWAYFYQKILTEDASVTLSKGDNPYVFTLKNRQDGGYIWTYDEVEGLTVLETFVQYPGEGVGADTLQAYTVTGEKTGDYTLRFRLKRSWETEPIAERTVEICIYDSCDANDPPREMPIGNGE